MYVYMYVFMFVKCFFLTLDINELQFLKAFVLIMVTVFGIFIVDKSIHPLHKFAFIVLILLVIVTLCNPIQS